MTYNSQRCINMLLARWYRWHSAHVRAPDIMMADFARLLSVLPADAHRSLHAQARLLGAGAAIYFERKRERDLAARAREQLDRALTSDDASRWYGPTRVRVTERGNRTGESNPAARLSDHEVELLLAIRQQDGKSYGWLAKKFECSKSAVQGYCTGRRRGLQPIRLQGHN